MLNLWQIRELLDVVVGWIDFGGWNSHDLIVGFATVDHLQNADWADLDNCAWNDRFTGVDEGIKRITIASERAGDRTVIGRINHRHRLITINNDVTGLVVNFIFGEAALRNFDGSEELFPVLFFLRIVEIRDIFRRRYGGRSGESESCSEQELFHGMTFRLR